ncbi:MAG: hypothetical protein HQK54_03475 [Oligoflexales bacterium]|nr:hypothetical protein [Oligoflexales bacterium]
MEVCGRIDKVVVLLACRDRTGLFRFPVSIDKYKEDIPGIKVDLNYYFDRLKAKIVSDAAVALGNEKLSGYILIDREMTPYLTFSDGSKGVLFLARIYAIYFEAPEYWPTLPEILKHMPDDRNRLPYLKVLQILSGSSQDDIEAVGLANEDMKFIVQETIKKNSTEMVQNS